MFKPKLSLLREELADEDSLRFFGEPASQTSFTHKYCTGLVNATSDRFMIVLS